MEFPGNSIIHTSLDLESRKEAFEKSAQVLKKDGALAIAQLNHSGRLTPINFNKNPFAPSAVKHVPKNKGFLEYGEPVELTKEEIREKVVENFVYAARYCYEAGEDYDFEKTS